MTGKELLYVEDALGHIQHIKTICETYSRNLQDPNLKAFVETLRQRNQELETKFLNVLGGATNGRQSVNGRFTISYQRRL